MPKTQGYESHATTYDEWFDENPDIYQAEIEAIKKLLPEGKGIEIGAGSGRFTAPLNIDTGIEPALAMREQAKFRGLSLIEGVAEQLPVEDNQFDYAIFITSTCFLDNPLKAYQEAARVTNDNGKIIIAFLEKNSELGKTYEKHKHENPFYCDATFYSYNEIKGFLEQAGFSDFQTVQTVLPENQTKQKSHDILPGHDQGAFIVLRAVKTS
ncbi:type 11 methyltransferase [Thiomicrorhabdus immobilis]|uniref:Type 11 methyltransferase n=1 Tax=Thiomicrorhabdus immobilis TaxID=2791037 RepID=A0ABM7MEC9_9GAMM|nr:class I SAM-dependent methyltransferase [Thiomicrorhabdus immobilis]BCN93782.1 type 11 methyltransferase [Thiomicrorhabdus immobilis]